MVLWEKKFDWYKVAEFNGNKREPKWIQTHENKDLDVYLQQTMNKNVKAVKATEK